MRRGPGGGQPPPERRPGRDCRSTRKGGFLATKASSGVGRGEGEKGDQIWGFLDDFTEGLTWPQGGGASSEVSGKGAQGQGQKQWVGRAWSLTDVVRTPSQWAILPGAGNFSCQVQPSQELCPTSGSVAALWPWGVGGIGQNPRTRGPTDMGLSPRPPD